MTIAKEQYVHGIHTYSLGPCRGAWGKGSKNKVGYLIIPDHNKPGSLTPEAWIDDELPSDIDILSGMRPAGQMGFSMSRLIKGAQGSI